MIKNPDYIQIPHQLLLDRNLKPTDRLLYGVIYWLERLRDGRCTASNKTLSEILGDVDTGTIQNGLLRLENGGYIKRIFKDNIKKIRLEIKSLIVYANVSSDNDRVSSNDGIRVSSNDDQNKSVYNKKNKEEACPHLEDPEFLKTLADFRVMRKSIKKPMTQRAEELLLAKLKPNDLKVAIRMLENSIEHNWLSVFPLKPEELANMSTPSYPKFVKPNVENLNRLDAMKREVLKSF